MQSKTLKNGIVGGGREREVAYNFWNQHLASSPRRPVLLPSLRVSIPENSLLTPLRVGHLACSLNTIVGGSISNIPSGAVVTQRRSFAALNLDDC